MKLKTATLCAGGGTSIHFALIIYRLFDSRALLSAYLFSEVILYVPIIIFFFVLYRNQK